MAELAAAGDIYTALIVTTQFHYGNSSATLMALFAHYKAVEAAPDDWLPCNYEVALAQLGQPLARARRSSVLALGLNKPFSPPFNHARRGTSSIGPGGQRALAARRDTSRG